MLSRAILNYYRNEFYDYRYQESLTNSVNYKGQICFFALTIHGNVQNMKYVRNCVQVTPL